MSGQPSNSLGNFNIGSSLNPFGNSRICVNVGNTIVSFAFFGVGPSLVAYTVLKVLEDDEETKQLVPFSSPATLPVAAFVLNRILNLNAIGLLALGGLCYAFQYFRGSSPSFLSTAFKNIMYNVSLRFDRFLQKSRYTIQDCDSMTIYKVYLPDKTKKDDIRVCWSSAEDTDTLNSFSIYLPGPQYTFVKYVECPVNYVVNPKSIIVSFTNEDNVGVVTLRIPKYSSVSILLDIKSSVCSIKQSYVTCLNPLFSY